MAAGVRASIPRAVLADSLALGYYRSPLRGFIFSGFAGWLRTKNL